MTQSWIDTKRLLNYGFENYKYYNVIEGEKKIGDINVIDSKVETLPVYINGNVRIPLTAEEVEKVQIIPNFPKEVNAPISENQTIGCVDVVIGDEVIKKIDIYTKASAELNTFPHNFKKVFKYWLEFSHNS